MLTFSTITYLPCDKLLTIRKYVHFNFAMFSYERSDLDETLKVLRWPFVGTNFSLQTPPESHVRKLQVVAEYLLQIELPEEFSPPAITSGVLADFQPPCLPVELLVAPLRKRFKYHFYGQKQTNRIDKPEW